LPLGGMPPKGKAVAPTLVGNQAADYHELKIQGQAPRLPFPENDGRRSACPACPTIWPDNAGKIA